MIVLGADTHKRSHTIAAGSAATGELMGERTIQVGAKGFDALVVWARELASERVWALEDCRHVSELLRALSDRARQNGFFASDGAPPPPCATASRPTARL